jgi:hypothetical protein
MNHNMTPYDKSLDVSIVPKKKEKNIQQRSNYVSPSNEGRHIVLV